MLIFKCDFKNASKFFREFKAFLNLFLTMDNKGNILESKVPTEGAMNRTATKFVENER